MDVDRIIEQSQRRARNIAAFLMMIRKCEGTDAPNGYRYLFGSTPAHEKLFASFDQHPNVRQSFRQMDGKTNWTTAAGAYQILYSTWAMVAKKLGLPDFSPESQDRAAIELIAECGALDDVREGRLTAALQKCSKEWASLPMAKAAQPRRSYDFASNAYAQAGGTSMEDAA